MTPLRSLTLIFVVLCAFAFIQSVQGLKCYNCEGSGCKQRLKECSGPETAAGKWQCFRSHLKDDPSKSIGGCAFSEKTGCDDNDKSKGCLCNTDGCNGSNRLGGFSLWPLAALTPLVIYLGMGSSST